MGKSGHESRLGHDFLTLKRLQKSRDQVETRDHFAHVCYLWWLIIDNDSDLCEIISA